MKKLLKTAVFGLLALVILSFAFFGFDASILDGATIAAATVVNSQLYNEIAVKELIKNLRHQGSFMQAIKSRNEWVNKDVIKIPIQGADPAVLINNTTYPIAFNSRDDEHVIFGLNKYETENTFVTLDEMMKLPYEKTSDVQMQHRLTLEEVTMKHTLHGVSPLDSTDYPVLETTGADDGTGRKRLTTADLVKLREQYKKTWKIMDNVVLVLSSEHVSDLLIEDKGFLAHYQNHTDALIAKRYMGFEVYESSYSPQFNTTAGTKIAFDSLTAGKEMTVAFYKPSVAKATGTAIRHFVRAEENPANRRNEIGFTLYHIGIAYDTKGIGAIISG